MDWRTYGSQRPLRGVASNSHLILPKESGVGNRLTQTKLDWQIKSSTY